MEAGGKQLKLELMEARQAPVKGKTSWPPTSSRTSSKKSLSKASQVWPLRLQGKKGDLGKGGGLGQSSCRDTGEGKQGVEDRKSHSPSPAHPERALAGHRCVRGWNSLLLHGLAESGWPAHEASGPHLYNMKLSAPAIAVRQRLKTQLPKGPSR